MVLVFRMFWQWQRRRQRRIDRTVLFPILRQIQRTEAEGMQAILAHVATDAAWATDTREWRDEPLEAETCSCPLPTVTRPWWRRTWQAINKHLRRSFASMRQRFTSARMP